jgi:hypothetical protein
MKFPLILIDFEASSLSTESYPIEVGVAIATQRDEPIGVWSSLIRPDKAWLAGNDWDPVAQKVHNIPAASLNHGLSAHEVALYLNQTLGPVGHAYCDGGRYDGFWLKRLYKAAGIAPNFALWDIAGLFMFERHLFRGFGLVLAESVAPHRAGPDARRLCTALVKVLDGPGAEATRDVR